MVCRNTLHAPPTPYACNRVVPLQLLEDVVMPNTCGFMALAVSIYASVRAISQSLSSRERAYLATAENG